MTLGQFATATGASPRWVLNALTRLGVPRVYDEPLARRLAVARRLAETPGVRLPDAYLFAGAALAAGGLGDLRSTWKLESADGSIVMHVDLRRVLTSYGAALSLARSGYAEWRRGRPARARRRGGAVARARARGIDIGLLRSALRRSPAERIRALSVNQAFVRALRGTAQ